MYTICPLTWTNYQDCSGIDWLIAETVFGTLRILKYYDNQWCGFHDIEKPLDGNPQNESRHNSLDEAKNSFA